MTGDSDANDARRLRHLVYLQLDPAARAGTGLSPTNWVISFTIICAVVLAVVETEPVIAGGHARLFNGIETGLGIGFSLEYLARFWAAAENPKYGLGWPGRLRYMRTWAAIFDALAVIASFATPAGMAPFYLRAIRLLRIIRLAKLSRLSSAMGFLIEAIFARRHELLFSLFVGVFFLLLSATCLYFVEGDIQPDKFGSIPRALWWATATLTTIGYGDVYPITPLGKVLAAISAICGIGLVAMPTGIMAAAFSDAVQKHLKDRRIAEWREKLKPVRDMGGIAQDLIQTAARELKPGKAALVYLTQAYSPTILLDAIRALDRTPLEELDDFDLVKLVATLRRLLGRAKQMLDRMARQVATKEIGEENVTNFIELANRISGICENLSTRLADIEGAQESRLDRK